MGWGVYVYGSFLGLVVVVCVSRWSDQSFYAPFDWSDKQSKEKSWREELSG